MEEKILFGRFIIKKRKEKNLTQKELADILFVTESAVSKWERGISYPDISLVSDICKVLDISEHELITASEDYHQREIERQARHLRTIKGVYLWTFNSIYGISLLVCFICNLAVSHRLDWFFIVLTAEMMAFSLTSLPLLLPKKQGSLTLGAFFISLNLLLFVCFLNTGGSWFGITFISLLFGFSIVFLPFVIRDIPLPRRLSSHKALICMCTDSILLFALLAATHAHYNILSRFFTYTCPIVLVNLSLPWILFITIRYIKINALFRASICFFAVSVYTFLINSIMIVLVDGKPFRLLPWNFSIWSFEYINGNVNLIITIVCLGMAIAFAIGGIMLTIKNNQEKHLQ